MRSEKIDSAKARTVKNLISNVSMSKWHNFFFQDVQVQSV